MNREQPLKFNWKSVCGAIALATATLGLGSSAARASSTFNPDNIASFKIAQVGVRRVNPPTPLNLRPRTHIPLPTNSRSSDYHHRGYYPQDRKYDHHDKYGYCHYHDCEHQHRRGHRRRRQRKGPVIIINPASSSYSNYSTTDGYIRIIRQ
ncbi:MAG: hypothetical protein AAFQ41_14355 [Cyanobacteria bacterium J06623_7]